MLVGVAEVQIPKVERCLCETTKRYIKQPVVFECLLLSFVLLLRITAFFFPHSLVPKTPPLSITFSIRSFFLPLQSHH